MIEIPDYCFNIPSVNSLVKIGLLPKSIEKLGASALNGVKCLEEEINLPNLQSIGTGALANTNIVKCVSLGKVTTTEIPQALFEMCVNLIEVVWPVTIISIGAAAFRKCSKLSTIELTDNIESIGMSAFEDCSSLGGTVNFPLLTGVLPKGVFHNTAIEHIQSLGNITELQGAQGNAVACFSSCANLLSAVLPGTLQIIGDYSFYNCANLSYDVGELPKAITSIGNYSFSGCSSLFGELSLPNLASIGRNAFNKSLITKVSNLGIITTLSDCCFMDCLSLTEVVFPETLTTIGVASLKNSSISLDLGSLNKNITTLKYSCFENCSNVYGEINLPNLSGEIGVRTFYKAGVTRISNLGSVTSIREFAFANIPCNYARIPATVTAIGSYAFSELNVLIVDAVIPPTANVGFDSNYANCKIYVPDDSVEAYKQASNWSDRAYRIYPLSEYVEGKEDEVTE